ncbi:MULTISPECIES: histidine kinase [unclassified Spirosoma]|uniref:sensor histidine kinase n=1 Tax=unclassified Spirosoma TaxID=2621999 RepID=UPI0009618B90|nr:MULTISPECIES: histidine kinase [unclassified Spirosoma]MBN8826839.1 histidine kinase [Spirosoma sp.]OJW80343.1 MAG: histidine kinase [Spirosoma sp. 48-14]
MANSAGNYLTNRQRWQLATTVFAIYWPIRLYVAVNHFSLAFLERIWPFWIMEITVTILFFGLWLTVTDWFQQRIFKLFHKGFLIEFDLPAQLITLFVAGGLAVLFNMGFFRLWVAMAEFEPLRLTTFTHTLTNVQKANRPKDPSQEHKFYNGLTIMAMLAAFYLAANRRGYQQLEDIRVKAEQLKQEAAQTQFVALKNQVNPHFLFNSFSILSSLIAVNPKLSIQFVGQLAKSYRYVLDQYEAQSVKLQDELEFLKAYTFLLQIRFGDKFRVVTDIPSEKVSLFRIAPLTLQLLIENAVKHNQMSAEEPLLVTLSVQQDYIWVTNAIRLRPKMETSTRLGLKNITKRYQLLTSRPVLIDDQTDVFTVKIPLLE